MLDPEATSSDASSPAEPEADAPRPIGPDAPSPDAPPAPPPATYDLPGARQVVGAGLQLAFASSRPLRRASLYIGLLSLAALGPAVILLLMGVGRLLSDPAVAEMLELDPSLVFMQQPDALGPLGLIYGLGIAGLVLFTAISIDAQAMAIAILAGEASQRPLRLWEALARARQVFWRLLGAGMLVGFVSGVVALVVAAPFLRPFDTNAGVAFIGAMIGALVVTPFAFVTAGIVLGDVGALDSLRRSIVLFKARKRVALVVTLFTLVTAAIQEFALGAGADTAVRVGEFLHLTIDEGGLPFVATAVVILAFVVAFGSLTFTVAAIVGAPQVAAFLGLTHYAGGLELARSPEADRPARVRWVSIPMAVVMVGMLAVAGLGLPSIASFEPRSPSAIVTILQAAANERGVVVFPVGDSEAIEDPTRDVIGAQRDSIDIVGGGLAYLPEVPDWLLADLFDCTAPNVACSDPNARPSAFWEGAYLFHQRMSGPPGVETEDEAGEWGPVVVLPRYREKPSDAGSVYSGATHAFVTRMVWGESSLHRLLFRPTFAEDLPTAARSTWIGNDLLTIVPLASDLTTDPLRWDVVAAIIHSREGGHDTLRGTTTSPLLSLGLPLEIDFFSDFGP